MMQVLKFGGSSVADATCVSRVLDIVSAAAEQGRVLVVSSAISGCTDALLALAEIPAGKGRNTAAESLRLRHFQMIRRLFTGAERREAEAECTALFEELATAPADACVSFGELFSTRILARKLRCEGFDCLWLDSRALVVAGNEQESGRRIRAAVAGSDARVFVAPGFIASDAEGHVTMLGRGGSDYSAALYAAALKADSLEIWTDVPGMMTANPRTVTGARTIPELSYQAAFDLAERGAKVLYPPTVAPVMREGIAFRIRNTFDPSAPGTLVCGSPAGPAPEWVGVNSIARPQEGSASVYLVSNGAVPPEVLPRLEDTLKRAGITPLSCKLEERAVAVTVRANIEKDTLRALHAEFFEFAPLSTLYLFIAGFGAVGQALTELIGDSAATVAERTGKTLRIAGLANSRKQLIDLEGIAPAEARNRLATAPESREPFSDAVLAAAPRHAVFVDCTDSENLWQAYEALLQNGIDIVSANRRSFAVPYVQYAAMHAAARQNGCFLRYETTVGSALPVLESIAAGTNASDELSSLEAVVSCTLNRILGAYTLTPDSFAGIVRKAQEEGLTETDPRMDLSGREALRKLLILAREAGIPLEAEDVEVESLIGPGYFDIPLDEFYRRLEAAEPEFRAREDAADACRGRQRFVASLVRDAAAPHGYKASIRVQVVHDDHPAYRLRGTENAVIIRSTYHPSPLLIQGPGEGARIAAASVLNDIIR